MRLIFTLFTFIFNFNAFARDHDFSYEDTAIKLGMNIVSVGKPFNFLRVNRFYTDEGFKRAMMVIENAPGKKEKLVITQFPKYVLIEYPISTTTYNSVVIVNATKAQLESFVFNHETRNYSQIDKYISFFVSKAHADEPCRHIELQPMGRSNLDGFSNYYSNDYLKTASSCIIGALEGVSDSTVGLVTSASDELKNLLNDPVGFWDEKVAQFDKLKDFFADFQVNMQKMMTSFSNLPDETKAQILCSFIGSIGTDVLISIFTAGATSAKLALSINRFLSKFMKIEGFIIKLNKLGKLKELPAKFYDGISKGLISDKRLSSIQSLTRHDFDDFALQLAQCSL